MTIGNKPPRKRKEKKRPSSESAAEESSPDIFTILNMGHRALYIVDRELIPYNEQQLIQAEEYKSSEYIRRIIGPFFRVPIDCAGREKQVKCIQSFDSEMKLTDVGVLIEGTFREETHKISNLSDLTPLMHNELVRAHTNLRNRLEKLHGREIPPLNACIIPAIVFLFYVDSIDAIRYELGTRHRIKNENLFIYRSDHLLIDRGLKSNIGGILETWLGLEQTHFHDREMPTSLIIFYEKPKNKSFPKNLHRAVDISFIREIGNIIQRTLWRTGAIYEKLIDDLPSVQHGVKNDSEMFEALLNVHENTAYLRKIQLLVENWTSTYFRWAELNENELSREIGKILPFGKGSGLINIGTIEEQEETLEKQIDALEHAVQVRIDITSSRIQIGIDKRFGRISVALGIFVVFEVLAGYYSWLYSSPDQPGGIYVWYFLIGAMVVGMLYIFFGASRIES